MIILRREEPTTDESVYRCNVSAMRLRHPSVNTSGPKGSIRPDIQILFVFSRHMKNGGSSGMMKGVESGLRFELLFRFRLGPFPDAGSCFEHQTSTEVLC